MKVCYCGGLDSEPTAPDHMGIKQGMENIGWDWSVVDPIIHDPSGQWVANEINRINPDLVIHGNTDSLTKNVCQHVSHNIKQVFWMLDYRTPEMLGEGGWYGWTQNAPYLDAIFISAKDHIPLWANAFHIPTFFAPHACWVPEKLEYDAGFERDVLFIGCRHQTGPLSARTRLLESIMSQVEVSIVNSADRAERNQIWTDMPKYYHSSKVVLDISHFWDNPGYCSGRYWYTATLGACAVTRWFPDCEDFFPDGIKWYFHDVKSAVEAIKGLLNSPKLIELTKKTAAEYAWENHTYKQRFQQMVDCL